MNPLNYKFFSKIGVFLFLVLCLFSFSGCFGESAITETEVLDVLNKIEVAAQNKDVDAIVATMSERAQLKATVTAAGQTQTLTFNRDQYRDFTKKVLAVASNYTYSRQNTQVKISSDGKSAIITQEVTESMTLNGQIIRSVSTEVGSLIKENGKLVTLFVEVNGRQV